MSIDVINQAVDIHSTTFVLRDVEDLCYDLCMFEEPDDFQYGNNQPAVGDNQA